MAQAAGAQLHRATHRGTAVHDVGLAAAALFDERAAFDHQHVAARLHQDACGQALVLAQAGRLLVGEAQAGDDLAVHHFRRHRGNLARVGLAGAGQRGRHADGEVAGEAFRHLDLDFEHRQVDHAQHRRVDRHVGALHGLDLADLAIERRAQGQRIHLALHFGHHRALALGQQLLVARIQARALALQARVLARVGQRDLGLAQVVLRFQHVDLRHRAALESALVALQGALGRLALDPGLVQRLLRIGAGDAGIQRGAAGFGFQAGQRGLLLRQLAAQFRAVDLGQRLALGHLVAGDHLQRDHAARHRVQGGAVGGDHAAIGGDVADQVAPGDFGDPQPGAVDRRGAGQPAARGEHDAGQQQGAARGGPYPTAPGRAGLGGTEHSVLRGGVPNHRRHALFGMTCRTQQDACQTQMIDSKGGCPALKAVRVSADTRRTGPVQYRTRRMSARFTQKEEAGLCAELWARSPIATWCRY